MIIDLKVGSVTNAQRALSILKAHGYKATVKKTQKVKKTDGCGYSVIVNSRTEEPIELIEKSGINVTEVTIDGVS